ncbi:DKNYY domain-containing protein [Myroides albus]|uniref:DKNYY family protein n=1 Tax=Myroides albus TaxID=2562892 RepID=A0A6I3LP92_9FLAO|nr:DKNYY domain-containing protein [Myroides albus]MTG98481.1 hypothetical protein [Myroides albus]UVD78238.1 DKNYY domain-containing protein [Myroides albus]
MTTLIFKVLNRKKYNITMIAIFAVVLIYCFINLISIVHAFNTGSTSAFIYITVFVVVILLIVRLRSVFTTQVCIDINEQGVTIKKGREVKSIKHANIVMVKRYSAVAGDLVIFFAAGQEEPFFSFESADRTMINTLLGRLENYQSYTAVDRVGKLDEHWTEYLNGRAVEGNVNLLANAREHEVKGNKKIFVIIGVVLGLVVLFPIMSLLISNNEYYEARDGQMYYGDVLLEGVNPDAIRRLDANVIKDSTHVYYKDQVLAWADRPTFKYLGTVFFSDKNGVYFETNKMFGSNEIKPLEGEYDKATFKALGNSFLYKDANYLYHLKAGMEGEKSPLSILEVEGLDLNSLEVLNDKWAKDKGQVYFVTWETLRPCLEIDVASFEVIDGTVAKDKTSVYYLSKDLKSDNARATKDENYAILKGADAPTFEKVDYKTYQDKNTEWSIYSEREQKKRKETQIRDREDVE